MEVIDNRPIVVTKRGQLILLDDEDDLEIFNKDNLVYWVRDIIALRDDLERVPEREVSGDEV